MQNPVKPLLIFFGFEMAATGIFVALITSNTIPENNLVYAIVGYLFFTFIFVGFLIYHLAFKEKVLRKRLRNSGVAASGTIINASETNMRVNNRPVIKIEIEVHDKLSGKFTATLYKTASILNVSALMPGNKINVLFNPGNIKEIVIDE